jgi:hypothetical protein
MQLQDQEIEQSVISYEIINIAHGSNSTSILNGLKMAIMNRFNYYTFLSSLFLKIIGYGKLVVW